MSRMAMRVVNLQRPRLLLHRVPDLERADASPDHRQTGRAWCSYFNDAVNGARHRFYGFNQPRQCGDDVLRMLLNGGPVRTLAVGRVEEPTEFRHNCVSKCVDARNPPLRSL